jgi:hypothetical protein
VQRQRAVDKREHDAEIKVKDDLTQAQINEKDTEIKAAKFCLRLRLRPLVLLSLFSFLSSSSSLCRVLFWTENS